MYFLTRMPQKQMGSRRGRLRIWRCGGNGQEKREVKNNYGGVEVVGRRRGRVRISSVP